MLSYYDILGVSPTATDAAISAAYAQARAAQQRQTDADPAHSAAMLQLLDTAYATLSDPDRRAAYDRSRDGNTTMRLPQLAAEAAPLARPAAPQPIAPAQPAAFAPAPSVLSTPEAPPRTCPHCGQHNPAQAGFCLVCCCQIANPCPVCGHQVTLNTLVCPHCGTIAAQYHTERFEQGQQTAQQLAQTRDESDTRARQQEVVYSAQVRATVVFWLVAGALVLAIILIVWLVLPLLSRLP